ncbi:MAG: hypothetical protein RLZZ15_1715 [Verrucomicrobiota bacterium]|jgi:uncharacterized protein (DUF2126 family)
MSAAPYSAPVWKNILACGASVEASLARSGVLLTMGGEPTFVPVAPAGAEWQTAALGPTKLAYARRFAHALIRATFPGAVVLETSGKHYPGEPLPRWTLLLQRRLDATPLWRDPTLLRADTDPGTHTPALAKKFTIALAKSLAVVSTHCLPFAEATAPTEPTGYVLPLDHAEEKWITDDWTPAFSPVPAPASCLLPLFPGDGPAGLRLPLAQLAETNLRRALTAEIRAGTLTIFIPPLLLPAYCALLGKIESTLVALKISDVVLAGYAPPPDPALPTIGLASDPGVLEINVSPCATWADFDSQLAQLYAAAAASGLVARKLQFNGREVGTGGGAHLVFGGPAGLLSPFFAFPAFLPSIIRYWQHHPALSYAFTGAYMGPSSQAPRIDESTFEALYELELACAGAENLGSPPNLPLFDLLFRDLLMDRSGNTHRAEISVDKLWNPYAPNGRLGLVEFRAFETHPAAAVSSVTALFVRAILARLAADPFKPPFVRWAGELHDKFFLPAFVWENLEEICADLAAHGLPFDVEWLRAAWEFRFPKLGEFALPISNLKSQVSNPTLEFRQALEAWPLLGESPNAGTVARTVDSSVDRIEAHLSDATLLELGLLLVNGLPCEFRPLAASTSTHPTSTAAAAAPAATAACGIRYRAFYLTPSLQPHVPVHAPLLLEWVDRATLTVVAAARWHVWNPTNSPYPAAPTDDNEAAARRAERWEVWPHTLGQPRFVPKIDFPPEGKHTLDLRRYPAQAR